jgi:hypothetical protein
MSKWRQTYKVHPAADVFPMMSDDELVTLGEDIKANGLKQPISVWDNDEGTTFLIDGRNRLEAAERAGVRLGLYGKHLNLDADPVAAIISLNIHRRHLTKQERADRIVAAYKAGAAKSLETRQDKLRQIGEVSAKGGRGVVDEVKAKAVSTAIEHGISQRTVERSLAKAEGRVPKPKPEPDSEGVEAKQRQRLLDVYNASLPSVRRWFRMKIGAEQ